MGYGVLGGTVLQCSFGMAPSVLNVLPTARVISSMPMASIADCVPLVNIMPFGMCSSMANPTVAAATAAAMGALTLCHVFRLLPEHGCLVLLLYW